ncbi:MAG: RluA family pseudouridine synthase [Oscillospiraceae bacterium]|nr:RluA family pseudouridine synthase [Oscillospiraceae bacterium]
MKLSYTALEKDIGRTVHSIMRKELRISATMMRRLKQSDAISVSGTSVFTNFALSQGDTVTIDLSAAEPPCDNIPEFADIEILFENEGILAVNKPVGMLIHPSRARHTGTLSNYVAGYLTAPCHAVNRLDRDTSGVVLFAKNSYMKHLASQSLSAPDAKKEYLALVCGEISEQGTIDVPITRLEERNLIRVPSPGGQRAVTHFQRLELIIGATSSLTLASLVKFSLETGRTHQIRVHCLHIGHPILGDKLYSNESSTAVSQSLGITTQALHAQLLGFTEPLSGQYIEITATPPFLEAISAGSFADASSDGVVSE